MAAAIQDALCLRRREVGDWDLVVTFLTRDLGKQSLVARGVRRPKAKNAAVCQPFVLARLQCVDGHKLGVLGQAQLVDSFYALREDLWRTAWATYVCELVELALPDGAPHPELFELLLGTLLGLVRAPDGAALAHSFELRLLAQLGWEPVLDTCAQCHEPFGDEDVVYAASAGGLLHVTDVEPGTATLAVTPAQVRALRRLLRPGDYGLELTQIAIPPAVAAGVRAVLEAHRRCHLEAQPKSAAFLDDLRRLEAVEQAAGAEPLA